VKIPWGKVLRWVGTAALTGLADKWLKKQAKKDAEPPKAPTVPL